MTDIAKPERAAVGLRSARGPVLLSVMLSTALVALDAMIIATAIPSIVADLGGFSQFPWLFSTYLLAQAVSVPIYGKLADVFGRKPLMLFGIGLFLVGSILCGVAWSMLTLILARVIQGLGAGAVLPMGVTIVGDLYSVAERARVQGYVASVWGLASVVGPALGGVFSEYLTWRWIFFINIPIGVIAVWKLLGSFQENVVPRKSTIDYLGALLLTVGCSALILALLEGGASWAWNSVASLGLLIGGVGLLVWFVVVEKRAAEPILPLWVFTKPILVGANLVAICIGVLMVGVTSYIPTYAQNVLGTSAIVAGFALAAMTIGWPIAAASAGRVYMRIGFRDTSLIGLVLIVSGSVLLAVLLDTDTSVLLVASVCFLLGAGLGFVASPTLVAVQSVVGWDRRGVVTGTNLFGRAIGSALGVAVFGAIVNGTLASRFANPPSNLGTGLPADVDDATLVLEPDSGAALAVKTFVREAISDATHYVFIGLIGASVLLLVGLILMPRRSEPLTFDDAAEQTAAAQATDATEATSN